MPPSLMTLPLASVTVRTTRRFMKRPSLVLLSTSGARLPSPAVVIWSAVSAVLHQERFHGFGARQREFVVVSCRAHIIRVSRDFHAVVLMLAQQISPAATGWDIRPKESRN